MKGWGKVCATGRGGARCVAEGEGNKVCGRGCAREGGMERGMW